MAVRPWVASLLGSAEPRLARNRAAFVRGRASTMDLVRAAPWHDLSAHPAMGGWSSLEILEHILQVERTVIARLIEQPSEKGHDPHSSSWIHRLPAGLRLRLVAWRFGKVRAPASATPTGTLQPETIEVALVGSREEVLKCLGSREPAQWRAIQHRHPILGILDGIEWIAFLAAHEARHRGQMRDVLGAVSKHMR